MRFDLVDRVLEISPDKAVALKHVAASEDYLRDHFPGFPVLPGVLMLEAMAQTARRVLERFGPPGLRGPAGRRAVLGRIRALRYGYLVKPGCTLRIEVNRLKDTAEGAVEFRAEVLALEPRSDAESVPAASARITLRAPIVDAATA